MTGLATLLALLAFGAAGYGVTFENVDYPDVAYPNEEISVSYTITLDQYTWDDVNCTGVTYKEGFIGEFYNHTKDPDAATADAKGDVTYTVKLTMPDTTGTYTVWGFGHIKGFATDYTQNLGTLEVKTTPIVQFAGTLGWNLVGRDHEVMANVRNADPSEIEEVSVYWDTVSHATGPKDKANYPNRTDVVTHQLLTPYYFNITLPGERCVVYILVHGQINGRDFYDSAERGISVFEEPEFNVSVPAAAFKGTNAVINWSIPTTAGAHLENTTVYWDTVSHSSAMVKENYAFMSDVLPGDDSRTYEVMLAMPDEVTTVYFIVHCILKVHGYEFYTATEYSFEVIEEPTLTVTQYPTSAFVGGDVSFVWTVSAPAGAVEETAIHWDTSSHAGAMDVGAYPHASVWMVGEEDRTYDVTIEMPDGAGTFYFIAHALVLGQDYYVEEELSIDVLEPPTVTVTLYPASAFVGEDVSFVWTVSAPASDVAETAIHWDTTSHAGALDVDAYPHASVWMVGEEDQTYDVTFEMPDEPGTLYFIAHALAYGSDFYVVEELSIIISELPTIAIVSTPDEAFAGETVTITWEVGGLPESEDYMTSLHWDTETHQDMGPLEYAEHSDPAQGSGHGTHTHDIQTPDLKVTLYLVASVEVRGVMVMSDEEHTVTVKLKPTITDVTGPEKVDGGKKVNITFALDDVDDPDEVEVLWDTESHDNDTDYPNSVKATDNGDGTWSVEFDAPDKDTEVFYVVHVEEDGTDVYSPEKSLTVKEKVDDSPGFGLIVAIVTMSVVAVYVASVRR